jgi:hypothetical protein
MTFGWTVADRQRAEPSVKMSVDMLTADFLPITSHRQTTPNAKRRNDLQVYSFFHSRQFLVKSAQQDFREAPSFQGGWCLLTENNSTFKIS